MFSHSPKFLLLSLVFAYIYTSQGSVEMHLLCGGIYNNCIIADCPQSVPVKKFENRSITGEDIDKSEVPRFYGPRCTSVCRPYAELVKLREMIEESKTFTLQLPWAQKLTEALDEADRWTASARLILV